MRVYIAHTYGRRHGLSHEECEANTYKAIEYGRQLILKGHNPFIPNLYHFVHSGWDVEVDDDVYLKIVMGWLPFCDALLVAEKPNWEGSGVQREIDLAEMWGIPVYYSVEDVK